MSASVSQPNLNTSSYQFIKLPPKFNPIGRPKGSAVNTVVGKKRKNPTKPVDVPVQKKVKFLERNYEDQGLAIASWLTNWSKEQIGRKKISNGDIIQDPIIFNRLRNTDLDLNCAKKHFDKKTFQYLKGEVDRLQANKLICPECKKFLG